MAHNHGHAHSGQANERVLRWALALTANYFVIEVVAGFLTGSLALLSDAAHMFTDVMALLIAVVAVRIAQRPADARRTFGYYRFEILAAAVNAAALILVAAYILYEAWQRFRMPREIESLPMLVVAVMGLLVNLASMRLLRAGAESSLNLKGAYLEVWSDALGSVGVIAAALIIRFTGFWQADPILAVLIGLWVLPRTWTLLSQSIHVLLEGVPEGLELAAVEASLAALPEVAGIHDPHVWSITSGRNTLTAHIVLKPGFNEQRALTRVSELLSHEFGIAHTTIQVETAACRPGDTDCDLTPQRQRSPRKSLR